MCHPAPALEAARRQSQSLQVLQLLLAFSALGAAAAAMEGNPLIRVVCTNSCGKVRLLPVEGFWGMDSIHLRAARRKGSQMSTTYLFDMHDTGEERRVRGGPCGACRGRVRRQPGSRGRGGGAGPSDSIGACTWAIANACSLILLLPLHLLAGTRLLRPGWVRDGGRG